MTKLLTTSELETLSDNELRVTLRQVWQELICSEQGSLERAQALASLENIERALCRRMLDRSV